MKYLLLIFTVFTSLASALPTTPTSPAQFFTVHNGTLHPHNAAVLPTLEEGRFSLAAGTNRQLGLAVSAPYFQLIMSKQYQQNFRSMGLDSTKWPDPALRDDYNEQFKHQFFSLGTGIRSSDFGIGSEKLNLSAGLAYEYQTVLDNNTDLAMETSGLLIPSLNLAIDKWRIASQIRSKDWEGEIGYDNPRQIGWTIQLQVKENKHLRGGVGWHYNLYQGIELKAQYSHQVDQNWVGVHRIIVLGTSVRSRPFYPGKDPAYLEPFIDLPGFLNLEDFRTAFYDLELGLAVYFDLAQQLTIPSVTLSKWF